MSARKHLDFSRTTRLEKSPCCECGYMTDSAGGPGSPRAGDLSLCIKCGSLNVFDDELRLRAPTIDEMLASAADADFQRIRRAVLHVAKEMGAK